MDAAALSYAFPCPCARVVFDRRGLVPGVPLRCPRCGRLFLSPGAADLPPIEVGGPIGAPPPPLRPPAAARLPARRGPSRGGALPEGAAPPPPPESASRAAARVVMLWTGFVAVAFGSWAAYQVLVRGARFDWGRLPLWVWAVGIVGATIVGLLLWAWHAYYFVYRPRREFEERLARRDARRRPAGGAGGAPPA